MGVSNNVTAVLNLIALLCSVPVISSGIWLSSKPDNECAHHLRWPMVVLGTLLLLVALAGFVGAYCNKQGLLAVYLLAMALLIAALLFVTVFAFVVTRDEVSYSFPGREYREYRLNGFSSWLRDHVVDPEDWVKIRACLAGSDVCSKLALDYVTADQFNSAQISPYSLFMIARNQSGCCKPPTVCGYTYVNPTIWLNPANPSADPDCYLWSNDQGRLCYDCSSCKAGLLGNLREEWRKANTIVIVAAVILIIVYLIACSAFRNVQAAELFPHSKS